MKLSKRDIFHNDFQVKPFWWEAYTPVAGELEDVPKEIPVAILGGGYTGLATALELHKQGISSCVLEAGAPGYGASTLSGGLVVGCGGIKTPLINKAHSRERYAEFVAATHGALVLLEKLIEEESINCEWTRSGFFKVACTRPHYLQLQKKATELNRHDYVDTRMIPQEQQTNEIGSDYYRGGMLTEQAGHLHPALYFKGLLHSCRTRGIAVCANAEVTTLSTVGGDWLVATTRGDIKASQVVVATNGYTGRATPQFKRRLVPVKAYIIATEPLSDDLAHGLSPHNRCFAESTRIAPFFRLSGGQGAQRMVFGSRVKWKDMEADEMAPYLYDIMLQRYPQLEGTKITHAWAGNVALTLDEQHHAGVLNGMHYALGCNGSGVANMTYLGTQVARKIADVEGYNCAYDKGDFPEHKWYDGDQRWFMPLIGGYFKFRDWFDRKLD